VPILNLNGVRKYAGTNKEVDPMNLNLATTARKCL
jgi:hypothetical protein